VVVDPDTLYVTDDDRMQLSGVHRVRVRHHGPTDCAHVAIPVDFIEGQDSAGE